MFRKATTLVHNWCMITLRSEVVCVSPVGSEILSRTYALLRAILFVREFHMPDLLALPPFVDREDLSADDVVLDVGCGDGRVLVTMAKVLGCRGIGIDVSQVVSIKYCSSLFPCVCLYYRAIRLTNQNTPVSMRQKTHIASTRHDLGPHEGTSWGRLVCVIVLVCYLDAPAF